ncbi:HET-domain-containing protein [Hypoxylon crocopeplum]|nr:HET-domain-containing protein [Hypoxylon crocopeplum]
MAIVTSTEDPNIPIAIGCCDHCRRPKNTLNPAEYMQVTFQELEDAVKAGCKTCTFRYYVASIFHPAPENQVIFFQLRQFTFDNKVYYEIFKTPGVQDDELSVVPVRNFLSGHTSSEQIFWSIESWIQVCLMEHDGCSRLSQSPYFPKRVLDVTRGRVVLREELDGIHYACLSHCWGPTQSPIKTLTTTIAEFKNEIPWSMLSKTFQDAVDICRRLHIDYLWIDSLCIIQDSKEDWREQSLLMADIYENAYLTIAATKSRDGSGGCYAMTDRESVDCYPTMEGSIYIRKKIPEFETFYRGDHWPLLTRAWVYQEMRLSPRVLHFGSQEVIWQCRTCRRSESGNNDSDAPTTLTDLRGKEYLPSSVVLNWYSTIYEYSHLSLTFEKDRFAALAAVTQREARLRGPNDIFLLGLWKHNLRQDLLWRTSPHQKARRPSTWKAPTWSWASVMSRVLWWGQGEPTVSDLQFLDCTRIQSTDIHYVGSPYLGDYTKAEIQIHGPLIRTTPAALNYDVPIDQRRELRLGDLWFNPELNADYDYSSNPNGQITPETELEVLPIATQVSSVLIVLGLALIPVKTTTSGYKYERIGLVSLIVIDSLRGFPKPIISEKFEDAQECIISHLRSLPTSDIILI